MNTRNTSSTGSSSQNRGTKTTQPKTGGTKQSWSQNTGSSKQNWSQNTSPASKKNWNQQSQQSEGWTKNDWTITAKKNSGRDWAEFSQDVRKLNDADIISDILSTQKGLVKMYGTAIVETDCEHLRDILNTQLSECASDQFDAFLYMNERGLYPTEAAPAPKLKQAKKLFASKEKTFEM